MNQLFDFSGVQVGHKLTRIIYNLWINEAVVYEITDEVIRCSVLVDCARSMDFIRKTGVNAESPKFGLVVNRVGQGHEYVEQLKKDLRAALEDQSLDPATLEALRLQLSHDW